MTPAMTAMTASRSTGAQLRRVTAASRAMIVTVNAAYPRSSV